MNIISLHQSAEIVELIGHLAFFGKLLCGFLHVLLIHITNRQDFSETFSVGGIAAAHASAADKRDAGAIVGREFSRLYRCIGFPFQEPERNAGSGRAQGTAFEKRTAGDLKCFGSHVSLAEQVIWPVAVRLMLRSSRFFRWRKENSLMHSSPAVVLHLPSL